MAASATRASLSSRRSGSSATASDGDLACSLEGRAKNEGDAGDRGRRGVDDAEDEDEAERNNFRCASVRLGVSGLEGRKTDRTILIDGC